MMQPDRRGGYQPPKKPAMVSGPGKYSRRTDGQPAAQLPDAAYGEQKTFQEIQRGAPMAAADTDPGQQGPSPVDMSGITPFSAASQYPNEAVTAGADMGAGVGSSALGLPQQNPVLSDPDTLQKLIAMLPALEVMASNPQASPEFRNFVREVYSRS